VTQILEVFHFPDQYRVPEVDIRCGRIEAGLDAQRLSGFLRAFQLGDQLFFANDFNRALADVFELFDQRSGCEIAHAEITRRP
jgi:hypothetical protein